MRRKGGRGMFRRIGRVIMNNFGLKVLAAVLAVILWLAIVNVADPDTTATYTIPVIITGTEALAEEGLTYEVLDNTNEFTFTVEGPRSYVEDLEEDDFHASVDLSDANLSTTGVDIQLVIDKHAGRVETTSPQPKLLLRVEELVKEGFDIDLEFENAPAEDYYVESMKADPAVASVTGPQSAVNQVASAKVTVDVDGAEEDFTTKEPIVLLDENGAELEAEGLTLDDAETEVSVQIFMTKTVPLRFSVSGEPAEGYWAAAPECDVESVKIAGEESAVRDVNEIVVKSDNLSVENAQQDVTAKVDISSSLPAGITLMEGEPDSVEVTIPVVEAFVTEVEMPTDNLTATNLAEGLTLTTTEESVLVQLTGPEDVIGSVNGNRLNGTIDASGLGAGSYDLPVVVETEGEYDAEATVAVTITKEE